jgi:hypothetical protein
MDQKPLLVHAVVVFVHQIDTEVHPMYPPGFRWAVQVGGQPVTDLEYCVAAGHEYDLSAAMVAAESHGAAACKALRVMNINATYAVIRMDYDPMPVEADEAPLARWGFGEQQVTAPPAVATDNQ